MNTILLLFTSCAIAQSYTFGITAPNSLPTIAIGDQIVLTNTCNDPSQYQLVPNLILSFGPAGCASVYSGQDNFAIAPNSSQTIDTTSNSIILTAGIHAICVFSAISGKFSSFAELDMIVVPSATETAVQTIEFDCK